MRTTWNMHERRLLDYLRRQPPEQVAELLRWDAEKRFLTSGQWILRVGPFGTAKHSVLLPADGPIPAEVVTVELPQEEK